MLRLFGLNIRRHDPYADMTADKVLASRSVLLLDDSILDGRFFVPFALCTSRGAFCFGGWHPFVSEITKPGTLQTFYSGFQPQSLADLYGLPKSLGGADRSPRLVPWFENEFGDYSREPVAPSSFYGPATPEIIHSEAKALSQLSKSITLRGYQPDRYGDVRGYFLARGEDIRFYVHGGRHRAACLAAKGEACLPAKLRPGVAPVVERESVAQWPFVRSGLLSLSCALSIFDRYFEWDGSERAVAAGLGT